MLVPASQSWYTRPPRLSVSVCGPAVCPARLALVSPCWRFSWPTEHLKLAAEPVSERNHSDWLFSSANQCIRRETNKKRGRCRSHYFTINCKLTYSRSDYHISEGGVKKHCVNITAICKPAVFWFPLLYDKYRVLAVWRGISTDTLDFSLCGLNCSYLTCSNWTVRVFFTKHSQLWLFDKINNISPVIL